MNLIGSSLLRILIVSFGFLLLMSTSSSIAQAWEEYGRQDNTIFTFDKSTLKTKGNLRKLTTAWFPAGRPNGPPFVTQVWEIDCYDELSRLLEFDTGSPEGASSGLPQRSIFPNAAWLKVPVGSLGEVLMKAACK